MANLARQVLNCEMELFPSIGPETKAEPPSAMPGCPASLLVVQAAQMSLVGDDDKDPAYNPDHPLESQKARRRGSLRVPQPVEDASDALISGQVAMSTSLMACLLLLCYSMILLECPVSIARPRHLGFVSHIR